MWSRGDCRVFQHKFGLMPAVGKADALAASRSAPGARADLWDAGNRCHRPHIEGFHAEEAA